MSGAAGGRLEGGQRSARCDLRIWNLGVDSTRQLLAIRQGRRIAPRISPGQEEGRVKREDGRGKKEGGSGKREEGRR